MKCHAIVLAAALLCTALCRAESNQSDEKTSQKSPPVEVDAQTRDVLDKINSVGAYEVPDLGLKRDVNYASITQEMTPFRHVKPYREHFLLQLEYTGPGRAKSPWDKGEGKPCDWMLEVALISWRQGHDAEVYRDPAPPEPKGEKPKAWYSDISASSPHLPLR